MTDNKKYNGPLMLVLVIIIAFAAYDFLTMKDQRSFSDKISDAYHSLGQGPDKAARQLEDRTPGQKLGDGVKDAGDKIKDSTKSSDGN
jgi:hypothetical protein